MKQQFLFQSVSMQGGPTGSSVSWQNLEWQGGKGVLSVRTFNKLAGDAQIDVNATLPFVGSPSLEGFPMAITEAGLYPFWAPKGAIISGGITVQPDGQIQSQDIALYGDA